MSIEQHSAYFLPSEMMMDIIHKVASQADPSPNHINKCTRANRTNIKYLILSHVMFSFTANIGTHTRDDQQLPNIFLLSRVRGLRMPTCWAAYSRPRQDRQYIRECRMYKKRAQVPSKVCTDNNKVSINYSDWRGKIKGFQTIWFRFSSSMHPQSEHTGNWFGYSTMRTMCRELLLTLLGTLFACGDKTLVRLFLLYDMMYEYRHLADGSVEVKTSMPTEFLHWYADIGQGKGEVEAFVMQTTAYRNCRRCFPVVILCDRQFR